MKRLTLIVPLVLLLIIGLPYATFGNGRQALLVMLNLPFALVGGVGFIALFGVAVLNGVVLVACISQPRDHGRALDLVVRTGAAVRLRPVLMTALVASVGFIPWPSPRARASRSSVCSPSWSSAAWSPRRP